jgi:hypothetical protein
MISSRAATSKPNPPNPPSPLNVVWSCDFETTNGSATWCGVVQAKDDQFDWTILNYPTPSDPTGPDYASTGAWYIYIEVTGLNSNDTAKYKLFYSYGPIVHSLFDILIFVKDQR